MRVEVIKRGNSREIKLKCPICGCLSWQVTSHTKGEITCWSCKSLLKWEEEVMKIGYASDPEGMSTLKYEIIEFDPERQVLVKAVNHWGGLEIRNKEEIKYIHEITITNKDYQMFQAFKDICLRKPLTKSGGK